MKRAAFAALVIVLVVSLCSKLHSNMVEEISHFSLNSLSSISDKLNKKDYDSARNEFYKYHKVWKKQTPKLAALITHEDIDEITRKNARLSASFSNEAETEAFAAIGELYELFSELDKKYLINLKNILQTRSVFI